MEKPDWAGPLAEAYDSALAYLTGLPDRPVGSSASLEELRASLDVPLPDSPGDPRKVIAKLAAAAEPGLVATPSGRFFGFVIGGATPAALAADWLTATWDQNAGLYILGPAAAVVEEAASRWLTELLGLPAGVSVGFVTGVQQANFTALAAARHEVLRRAGWNVEADGLAGHDGVEVLNEVVLNQVLVRFRAAGGDDDAHTRAVLERVRRDGTCWMSGTTWRGRAAMRISVSNWSTVADDVDRSVEAILRCVSGSPSTP